MKQAERRLPPWTLTANSQPLGQGFSMGGSQTHGSNEQMGGGGENHKLSALSHAPMCPYLPRTFITCFFLESERYATYSVCLMNSDNLHQETSLEKLTLAWNVLQGKKVIRLHTPLKVKEGMHFMHIFY